MIKLFCIPGGAASATAYLPWTKVLDRSIRLCLLEVPGRRLRRNEKSLETMDAVADDLFENLKSQLKEDDDYMILGYCFGAVAGYELYRRILSSGMLASDKERSSASPMVLLNEYFPEESFESSL